MSDISKKPYDFLSDLLATYRSFSLFCISNMHVISSSFYSFKSNLFYLMSLFYSEEGPDFCVENVLFSKRSFKYSKLLESLDQVMPFLADTSDI